MTITALNRLDSTSDFTSLGPGYIPQVTELSSIQVDGVTWVYGHTSNPDDGIITMRMDDQGVLSYVSNTGFSGGSIYRSFDESDPSGFAVVQIEGSPYLIGSNYFEVAGEAVDHGLHVYEVQANGELAEVGRFTRNANTIQVSDAITMDGESEVIEIATNGAGVFNTLFKNDAELGFDPFRIETSGPLTSADNADIFGLVEDEGRGFFFYTRADTHTIFWSDLDFFIGGLVAGSGALGAQGAATDMEQARIGDQGYLITTNPTYGLQSIAPGSLLRAAVTVDSLGRDAAVERWEASEIETIAFGGRSFVVTGGSDIGIVEVNADGTLFLAEQFAHDQGAIHDLTLQTIGDAIYILASSDSGVASYRFDPGPAQNQTGTMQGDVLTGDARDNVIVGLAGNDTLKGLAGDDQLYGNLGNDRLEGGDGNDSLFGSLGDDTLIGNAGDDRLRGEGGKDRFDGGQGDDYLFGGADDDILFGNVGADWLVGGTGNDQLSGGGDADILTGQAGDDRLNGGAGDDVLRGELGADRLFGSLGRDSLYGGPGADVLRGEAGDDVLNGNEDNDILFGDAGADRLNGAQGNDTLYGGAGNDVLAGLIGADVLAGGAGRDLLNGGAWNDLLFGGSDADRLFGGAGNDVLNGGAGRDFMNGGAGRDRFVFTPDGSVDVISQFQLVDVIDMRGFGTGVDFDDLSIRDSAGGVIRISAAGQSLELHNNGLLSASDLSAGDFLFA